MKSISTGLINRLAYSRDASIYRIVPQGVIWPKTEPDIIELLSYATQNNTSVTFRAGGTSLSGQSVSNGIIADISRHWQKSSILDNGYAIQMQPGVIGSRANLMLKSSCMKIGPDPASINSAMIGGIVNNNSSGMACGTEFNSYHTVKSIRFILANGHIYNSDQTEDRARFIEVESKLTNGLSQLRKNIKNKPNLVEKIRSKYRIKNTMGYSLNAFLDYDHPMDIFTHLLVGSEGTLAFLSEVILNTVPDPPEKSTGLFLFENTIHACDLVPHLAELGVSSLEYMDYSSLLTAKYLSNSPISHKNIPENSAALLVEYEDNYLEQLHDKVGHVSQFIQSSNGYLSGQFTEDEMTRMNLWTLRKGLYPTVGALRKSGTSVITEDIAVDSSQLGQAVLGLLDIFKRTDTEDAVTFGHAKDGNIHFVASVDLENQKSIDQYEKLIDEMADLTIGKLNGSLKAEHGTGRNMAPFVEMEWGHELYDIMKEVKSLSDPHNILNPGVLINTDKKHHLSNLKILPKVNDEIDLCVECGFCEKICPSNGLSLTPRQRIILARELEELSPSEKKKITKELRYVLEDTCAVDGLCEMSCPVNINTGAFVKELRQLSAKDSSLDASWIVEHFTFITSLIKGVLKIINIISKISPSILTNISKYMHSISNKRIPIWSKELSQTIKFHQPTKTENVDYILFSTCANRILSPDGGEVSLAQHMVDIGNYCGLTLAVPEKIDDLCCGMVYHSRGQYNRAQLSLEKTVNALYKSSNNGLIPIIVDMSPCTYHVISQGKYLSEKVKKKWTSLTILDSVSFLHELVQSHPIKKLDQIIAIHPTCSNTKLSLNDKMMDIAQTCSSIVYKAGEDHCCGMAGDRGLKFPELTHNATKYEVEELSKIGDFDKGYSSGRTCEIGMGKSTGKPYFHIALLVKEALEKKIST